VNESFQFANMNTPSSRFCHFEKLVKQGQWLIHSKFLAYDYSHVKSCSNENGDTHKNGLIAKHMLLHD